MNPVTDEKKKMKNNTYTTYILSGMTTTDAEKSGVIFLSVTG
jgi:hypothetical protein